VKLKENITNDKYGNKIRVGDTIKYTFEDDSKPDIVGVVTMVLSDRVFANWSDDPVGYNASYVNRQSRIEIIAPATKVFHANAQETFSEEDEKLLQELTERKARVQAKWDQLAQKIRDVSTRLHSMNSSYSIINFFKDKSNAEDLIQTLKEFHGIK